MSRATLSSSSSVWPRLPTVPSSSTAIFDPAAAPSSSVATATGRPASIAATAASSGSAAPSSCTNTRTVPPHIRPTPTACSSLIP